MSYETARYILWALMCVPVLWLGLHLINSVINDTLDIKRRNAARKKTDGYGENNAGRKTNGGGRGTVP